MAFQPKPTKHKLKAEYKTLYIASDLVEKVNSKAKEYNTSFNNLVVSILEYFFENGQ